MQCRACLTAFVGDPERIMAHSVSEMRGISTCAPVDTSLAAEVLRERDHAVRGKARCGRGQKRKVELQAIASDAREKTRRRQATLSETTGAVGTVDWTPREVANST